MAPEPKFSEDLVPIGQFKSDAASWLKKVREEQRSVIITQNGRAAAVMISPAEFDELRYRQRFVESIARGLADVDTGNTKSTAQLRKHLAARRRKSR